MNNTVLVVGKSQITNKKMEDWNNGILEEWVMSKWCIGEMEGWKIVKMGD